MPRHLPPDLFAKTLNATRRREQRGKRPDRKLPYIHVSSLVRNTEQDRFCAREFILDHAEDRDPLGSGVPAKFQLLYDTGKMLGDYIISEFMRKNKPYRHMLWGDWSCGTKGHTVHVKKRYHDVMHVTCKECNRPVNKYIETDLFNKSKTVVGHADIIMRDDSGVFHVWEVKTIDRADIDWDHFDEPLGDHLVQVSNYRYMLVNLGYNVSRHVRILYIDRSMTELYRTAPFKEFMRECIDLDRLANIYAPAAAVTKAMKTKILPPRICKAIDCTRAKSCRVAISCFERQKKTFQIL